MNLKNVVVIFTIVLIISQVHVQAYTDPGTGALLWQILAGAFVGLMFYTRRIISWVRGLRNKKM